MAVAKRKCEVCPIEFEPRSEKQVTCSLGCEHRSPRHKAGHKMRVASIGQIRNPEGKQGRR